MRLLSIKNYSDFECIGGECPISCCGGNWSIVVDKESSDYYRSIEGDFGYELRNGLKEICGKTMFKLDNNGNCTFLNENGLCRIYRNLGADNLCFTCKKFPRDFFIVGDILFCFLTSACPEATRMILQEKNPIEIILDDSDFSTEMAERFSGQIYNPYINEQRFDYALRTYVAGIHILQNRSFILKDRLFLVLLFIERFQLKIKTEQDPTDLLNVFSNPRLYSLFLENKPDICDKNFDSKIRVFMTVSMELVDGYCDFPSLRKCAKLINTIKTKEQLNFNTDKLSEIYDKLNSEEYQIEFEQIIVYRFFAFFMTGFENTDYFEKVAYEYILLIALITYAVIWEIESGSKCTCKERILFYSLCSRVDHATIGKNKFRNLLESNGYFNTEFLLKLIS